MLAADHGFNVIDKSNGEIYPSRRGGGGTTGAIAEQPPPPPPTPTTTTSTTVHDDDDDEFIDEDGEVSVDEPRYKPPSSTTPKKLRKGIMKTFFKNHVQADYSVEETQKASFEGGGGRKQRSKSLTLPSVFKNHIQADFSLEETKEAATKYEEKMTRGSNRSGSITLPDLSVDHHQQQQQQNNNMRSLNDSDLFDESASSVRSASSAPAYMRNIVVNNNPTTLMQPEERKQFEKDVKEAVVGAVKDQSEGPRLFGKNNNSNNNNNSDSPGGGGKGWNPGKQVAEWKSNHPPRRSSDKKKDGKQKKNRRHNRKEKNHHAAADDVVSRSWHGISHGETAGDWGIAVAAANANNNNNKNGTERARRHSSHQRSKPFKLNHSRHRPPSEEEELDRSCQSTASDGMLPPRSPTIPSARKKKTAFPLQNRRATNTYEA